MYNHGFIDLTGQRFGRLMVISRAENNKHGDAMWNCVCDCGNTHIVNGNNLKKGTTQSCGCLAKEQATARLLKCISESHKGIIGKKFGHLTVVRKTDEIKNKGVVWECKCDCGNPQILKRTTGELNAGRRLSCGCANKGEAWNNGVRERLYVIWCDMIDRCYNKNSPSYKRYGGRGIIICGEWRHNYKAFKTWALSHGYLDTLTIDRINNDGIYEPSNCRWADVYTQARNKSSNRFLEYNGERKTLAEWANQTGLKYSTLSERLKRGWSVKDAIERPLDVCKSRARKPATEFINVKWHFDEHGNVVMARSD